jgi:transposase
MLQITPHHTLLLAVTPVDFRRGIDGLAAVCRQVLDSDPFGGSIFIFTNKSRGSIKILVYDGNGFWLIQKRFSKGRLAWWPKETPAASFPVNPSQLQILLSQGDPSETSLPPDWRPLTPQGTAQPKLQSRESRQE